MKIMNTIEILARIDSGLRPLMTYLPPRMVVATYSAGRLYFLNKLVKQTPNIDIKNEFKTKRTLWGLNFGNSLFNAAGMFKNGMGYELASSQGAGAFLCGTTTSKMRLGNKKFGIRTPFAPLPRTNSAINWMGLPNPGHSEVAGIVAKTGHKKNCPIGASLATDSNLSDSQALAGLLEGLLLYDKAGICFMEINESCPNVAHSSHNKFDDNGIDISLIGRLEEISKKYLKNRKRQLPVIVKFSNDTSIESIPALIDILLDLGFDGINLGNTSVSYPDYDIYIHKSEKRIFDYFTNIFGGGLSGNILKENSLKLAKTAVDYIKTKQTHGEFHVIRTGGVETFEDIQKSEAAGIALNQWFTGYFEAFSEYGHQLYLKVLEHQNIEK